MNIDVLVGLQWGDEGKGKIVDLMATQYNAICRYQGGPNAGHTIEYNNNRIVLHTVPSGILHEGVFNYIGNGVVIDPIVFVEEIAEISKYTSTYKERIYISDLAHLILPTHKILDKVYEAYRGKRKVGSTLKGIGPAYSDKYNRIGLKVYDCFSSDFIEKVNYVIDYHLKIIRSFNINIDNIEIDIDKWLNAVNQLKSFKIISVSEFYEKFYNKNILAEGAQGTLLDIDGGTYPYVTSSNTFAGGVCNGLMVSPKKINNIYGVFKAYTTRVGEGPFPTELNNDIGNTLRLKGFEFGSTTGRPRRCGWLDLVALKFAVDINSTTNLIMTKIDVLSELDEINLCVAYKIKNEIINFYPGNLDANLEPVYISVPGWRVNLGEVKSKKYLPYQVTKYIEYIENYLNRKINFISLGPDRYNIIPLD
ncbi:MAG: adenylosuccinate synthase [Bacteroidales bacterium]|nr:adenylosuccinate synthase [Bacteroidales bacterium]